MRTKRTVKLEQFFTDVELAKTCVNTVSNSYDLESFDIVLEPSAGDGVFYNLLPAKNKIGFDIDPKSSEIYKMDFFDWQVPSDKKILTIGNPPFGQRGALAISFLNKACEFSDVVAFILPRSFKKDTFMNRIDKNFHLVECFDCDSFRTPDGSSIEVKSVFQIWERRTTQRELSVRQTEHDDFELKHAHMSRITLDQLNDLKNNYDFGIAQVGSNFSPKDVSEINAGSYWFVKEKTSGVRSVFEKLDFSFLDGMNLSFKSLSKKDIIQAYINVCENS